MSVTDLQTRDVTAIEIALDLEMPRLLDPPQFFFSGPSEPRICLVTGFALTSHLKRIVAAVGRAVPARMPSGFQISSARSRSPTPPATVVTIQPMLALLRLQSKLIRAIEPGLANELVSFRTRRDMEETAAQFIGNFISSKALPTFEPPCASSDLNSIQLNAIGFTIYRLGLAGAPESILAHWAYSQDGRSIHALES